MNKKTLFTILILCQILWGCKELYNPTLSEVESLVVVKGLITDEHAPYYISLSTSTAFNATQPPYPIKNAIVYIEDSDGNSFLFSEVKPGKYRSPENFVGLSGKGYTLKFTTPEGNIFQSNQTFIKPKVAFQELIAEYFVKKDYITNESGELIENETHGYNAIINGSETNQLFHKIRFKSDVVVFYNYELVDPTAPPDPMDPDIPIWYCWKILDNYQGTDNIVKPIAYGQDANANNAIVAFLPKKISRYYYLTNEKVIKSLLIKLCLYNLNDESYKFYLDANNQLSSNDYLFSPIVSQIYSNIKCVNNPNIKAVGLFEASSVYCKWFILRENSYNNSAVFEEIVDYLGVPPSNCIERVPPSFWID